MSIFEEESLKFQDAVLFLLLLAGIIASAVAVCTRLRSNGFWIPSQYTQPPFHPYPTAFADKLQIPSDISIQSYAFQNNDIDIECSNFHPPIWTTLLTLMPQGVTATKARTPKPFFPAPQPQQTRKLLFDKDSQGNFIVSHVSAKSLIQISIVRWDSTIASDPPTVQYEAEDLEAGILKCLVTTSPPVGISLFNPDYRPAQIRLLLH
jgi:hypothetical protein